MPVFRGVWGYWAEIGDRAILAAVLGLFGRKGVTIVKHVVTLAIVLTVVTSGSMVLAAPGDVGRSIKSPCDYAAGLATDGKSLYVADWRTGKICRVNPADGTMTKSWEGPTPRPHGLAYGDGFLYVCDDHTGMIYGLNLDTGISERSYKAPGGTKATGLAYANGTLFVLEGDSRRIYALQPADGTINNYIPIPDEQCASLGHDGHNLWICNRDADEIYLVDDDTGAVVSVIDAPGPHASGLTWLDGYLWNVDFQTDTIYQIIVRDKEPYKICEPRRAKVEFFWALTNYGPGELLDVNVSLAVPENLVNQQLLSKVHYSKDPDKMVKDHYGQPCALFGFESIPAGGKGVLTYTVDAEVASLRYLIFPEDVGTLEDIPEEIRREYTRDESRFRINSPYIKETVEKIVGDEKNPYWIARKLYNHLLERIEYLYIDGWDVPEVVIRRGSGSCSEYAFCMIALCRAAGIPARYQGSTVWRKDAASIDLPFHRWAQIYLPNYGWIPVDPSRGDHESPVEQAKCFGQLANEFMITTHGGGNSEYMRWGYNHQTNYKSRGYCNVKLEEIGFWEPLDSDVQAKEPKQSGQRDKCER